MYFRHPQEWRNWLHESHNSCNGVFLLFYKVTSTTESMRWEEAMQVAYVMDRSTRQYEKLMMKNENNFLHQEKTKVFGAN